MRQDTVTWSSPIEELFGFPAGIRGFSVHPGTPDEQPEVLRPPADFGDPADIGSDLLAPILAPIRAGVPPSEFDLHYTVTCPDGTMRVAVIRASPMAFDPDGDGRRPTRAATSTPAWSSTSPPSSGSSGS